MDDGDVAAGPQVARDLLDGAHRRRQADALGRAFGQAIEALEAERKVGTALGARDGMDLIDDDRVDIAQRLARLRREHEEERLRRGDEDVGGCGEHSTPILGRRVAGAHPDGDVGLGQPETLRLAADASQR